MGNDEIIALLQESLNLQEIKVTGEGGHYQIIAIDDSFDAMSRVKRQQFVYRPLSDLISEGTIHAVSIKTFTTAQWERDKLFN